MVSLLPAASFSAAAAIALAASRVKAFFLGELSRSAGREYQRDRSQPDGI